MEYSKKNLISAAVAVALCVPMGAWATNGYFAHGYGIKAKGMGGAGVAYSQDALAAATNPAGMVMVGNRVDFGLEVFMPDRAAQSNFGPSPNSGSGDWYEGNETKLFYIPEFGYNRMINSTMAVGVSVYGNGGMNTDYKEGIYSSNPLGLNDQSSTGINLEQLFIAPTFSMKINEQHSFGVSLNLAYQRFEATGLSDFCGFTDPGGPAGCADGTDGLSEQGTDSSTGWGVRVGWVGKLNDMISLGATYQSETKMSKFDKYDQLFAEQGGFNIPANYALGIAIHPTPKTTVLLDIEVIKYGDIKSIANPNNGWSGGILGTDNGPGFGWDDMTVYKLGVQHQINNDVILRAGFNYGGQPISESETQFNVIAPGIVEKHLTLGGTWTLANGGELSGYYMHAFEETVKGDSPANPQDAGHGNLRMSQDAIGIAYGWKF